MQIIEIPADQCDAFKQLMAEAQWKITHQDAGQTHLVGWGYEIHWMLDDQKVILRYNDQQGVATALLEIHSSASNQIQRLLQQLHVPSTVDNSSEQSADD